jgi:hypothetical protein
MNALFDLTEKWLCRGINHTPAFLFILSLACTPALAQTLNEDGGYERIFNGVNLEGWSIQWPGIWGVDNFVLKGWQHPDGASHPIAKGDSWLFTNREWDDFTLSLNVQLENEDQHHLGNSGVGFRMPSGIEGRPSQYGFEMQIDKGDPVYPTGSIYNHLPPTQELHRVAKWNNVDITAHGEHITVFINREKVIDAIIPGSLRGRIGFQVHGNSLYAGQVVNFRNVIIKDLKPQFRTAPSPLSFEIQAISDIPSEGCAIADINGDGILDITCGPNWYEGPHWTPHPYRTITSLGKTLDNYNEIPMDVNQDGWVDIVCGGWFSSLKWLENPGDFSTDRLWKEHIIADNLLRTETITAHDLNGDGFPDLIPSRMDETAPVGYFAYVGMGNSESGFVYKEMDAQFRGVGCGFGDINNDGKIDFVTPTGWYQAPNHPDTEPWLWHGNLELPSTCVPILVDDFNLDGKADLLIGNAHGFGLAWLEQTEFGWETHVIDNTVSQIQSVVLADMDGDGTNDIITGKRYLAKDGFDPGYAEPLALFWFKVQKGTNPVFTKHTITYDENIGSGLQLRVVDIDNDRDMDIVTAGKTGLFLIKNNGIHQSSTQTWMDY